MLYLHIVVEFTTLSSLNVSMLMVVILIPFITAIGGNKLADFFEMRFLNMCPTFLYMGRVGVIPKCYCLLVSNLYVVEYAVKLSSMTQTKRCPYG